MSPLLPLSSLIQLSAPAVNGNSYHTATGNEQYGKPKGKIAVVACLRAGDICISIRFFGLVGFVVPETGISLPFTV